MCSPYLWLSAVGKWWFPLIARNSTCNLKLIRLKFLCFMRTQCHVNSGLVELLLFYEHQMVQVLYVLHVLLSYPIEMWIWLNMGLESIWNITFILKSECVCVCVLILEWRARASITQIETTNFPLARVMLSDCMLWIRLRPSDIVFFSFWFYVFFSRTTPIQFRSMLSVHISSAINWLEEKKKIQVSSCDFIHPIFIGTLIFLCSVHTSNVVPCDFTCSYRTLLWDLVCECGEIVVCGGGGQRDNLLYKSVIDSFGSPLPDAPTMQQYPRSTVNTQFGHDTNVHRLENLMD